MVKIIRCVHCARLNQIARSSSDIAVCGECNNRLYVTHNDRILFILSETHLSASFLCIFLIFLFSFSMLLLTSNFPGLLSFCFIMSFWLLSLIIHEYMHAAAALYFGDVSIRDKDYLKFDLTKYFTFDMSLLLPMIIIFNGGIGFPGAAVWIDYSHIRSRIGAMLISVVGPLANFFLSLVLALTLKALILLGSKPVLINIVAFSLFLQIQAWFFNLLPIPGLDGFGIIRPFLPISLVNYLNIFGVWILVAFFLFLFLSPNAVTVFKIFLMPIVVFFGGSPDLVAQGYNEMRFWK